jgi:hypothetical protein
LKIWHVRPKSWLTETSRHTAVTGDLVIQSAEAEQLKGDGVMAQLHEMFPTIAKQKVQPQHHGWTLTSVIIYLFTCKKRPR